MREEAEITRLTDIAARAIAQGVSPHAALASLEIHILKMMSALYDRLSAGAAELSGLACAAHAKEASHLGWEEFARRHTELRCVWCLAAKQAAFVPPEELRQKRTAVKDDDLEKLGRAVRNGRDPAEE